MSQVVVAKGEFGFKKGTITLSEPKYVYYSGQEISGTVNFELSEPVPYLYINVIYKGEAIVSWTEEEQEKYLGNTRYRDVKYSGHEEYLNFSQCLSGGNGISVLPAGVHSLPFRYQIPFHAPSSFEGEKGQVTYSVTAVMVLQDNSTSETITKKFDVVAPLDLNTEESLKPMYIYFEGLYNSCSCFCAGNPIDLAIKAPYSGYAPGEVIPLTVEAKNDSNVEITEIIFEVARKMRYLSQQPMSAVVPPEEIIASKSVGPILSKSQKQYVFDFKLPDFIALNLDNCGIIDVGYYLKVTIKASGCNDDMFDEAEICMGLVPVGSNSHVKTTHPMAEYLPNAPIPKPEQNNEFINHPQAQLYPPGSNLNVSYPGSNTENIPIGFVGNFGSNKNISHSVPFLPFPNLPQGQFVPPIGQSGSQPSIAKSPPPPYSAEYPYSTSAQTPYPFSPSAKTPYPFAPSTQSSYPNAPSAPPPS